MPDSRRRTAEGRNGRPGGRRLSYGTSSKRDVFTITRGTRGVKDSSRLPSVAWPRRILADAIAEFYASDLSLHLLHARRVIRAARTVVAACPARALRLRNAAQTLRNAVAAT